MTPPLPHDWASLATLALLLGLRHGVDPDHLAAVDSLTRVNSHSRPRLAQAAGALFSLGHGLVILAAVLLASLAAGAWQPPPWVDRFGSWVSVLLLLLLSAVNLAALRSGAVSHVHPGADGGAGPRRSLRMAWMGPRLRALLHRPQPLAMLGVGALFAVSFDTLSLAALWAAASLQVGGGRGAGLLLAGLFVLGMLTASGLCGLGIAALVRRADAAARIASQAMTLAVSGVSLVVALIGLASLGLPAFGDWADSRRAWVSAAAVLALVAALAAGLMLARLRRVPRPVALAPRSGHLPDQGR